MFIRTEAAWSLLTQSRSHTWSIAHNLKNVYFWPPPTLHVPAHRYLKQTKMSSFDLLLIRRCEKMRWFKLDGSVFLFLPLPSVLFSWQIVKIDCLIVSSCNRGLAKVRPRFLRLRCPFSFPLSDVETIFDLDGRKKKVKELFWDSFK